MSEEIENNTIFFLGAGASLPAGVPTTYKFAEEFVEFIKKKDSELYNELMKIVNRLKSRKIREKPEGEDPDIELIYETLHRLSNSDEEVILALVNDLEKTFEIYNMESIQKLIRKLKSFIKRNTNVSVKKISYLSDLRKFLSNGIITEIYTTNYDNVIEQFCFHHNIDYSDGFELFWDLKNSDKKNIQLRIYKIHGSLGWYQTSSGRFIKIPIFLEKKPNINSKLVLHTEEEISDMIMYPMQKWERVLTIFNLLEKINEFFSFWNNIEKSIKQLNDASKSIQ